MKILREEILSTYWISLALLVLLLFLAGPPLLMMWVVGPFNVVGFIFWSIIWLIVRAGIAKYV